MTSLTWAWAFSVRRKGGSEGLAVSAGAAVWEVASMRSPLGSIYNDRRPKIHRGAPQPCGQGRLAVTSTPMAANYRELLSGVKKEIREISVDEVKRKLEA